MREIVVAAVDVREPPRRTALSALKMDWSQDTQSRFGNRAIYNEI